MVGLITQAQNTSNPLSETKTYDPAQIQVNQDTDTVSGQINRLLREDSPILQQARTYAKQAANRTGTLNSSMTDGAIFGAMLDRATPIAAADAGTYYDANRNNVGARNDAFEFGANAFNSAESQLSGQEAAIDQIQERGQIETQLQDNQFQHQTTQNALDRQLQERMQAADQSWRTSENLADRALQKYLQGEEITHQERQALLDREQQERLQQQQFGFQAGQAELDREQQQILQDTELNWRSGESALDRTQQATQADLDRQLREVLQNDQQDFEAAQNELTRQMQQSEIDQQVQLTILRSQQDAINSVLMDANLTPEAKSQAIQNIQAGSASAFQAAVTTQNTAIDEAKSTVTSLLDSNRETFAGGFEDPVATQRLEDIVLYAKANKIPLNDLANIAQQLYPDASYQQIQETMLQMYSGNFTHPDGSQIQSAPTTTTTPSTGTSAFATQTEQEAAALQNAQNIVDAQQADGDPATEQEKVAAVTQLSAAGMTAEQMAQYAVEQYGGSVNDYLGEINRILSSI